ncbi:MAG: cation transporter [Clostridia bacterium]
MSTRQTTWHISGMHCPRCETAIVKAVSVLPGIRDAGADWRKGILTAMWDPEITSEDAVDTCVAEAGYTLEPLERGRKRVWKSVIILFAAAVLFVILEVTPLRALLSAFPAARAGMSFTALFILGLTTSLHCVGMCGGINLAQSAMKTWTLQ